MTYTAEQFIATNKANVEALASLSSQAFGGFEKLVELNLATSKAALAEGFTHVQSVLAVKTPQELVALHTSAVQPSVEKSVAYGRDLYSIASSTGAEIAKALESKAAEVQQTVATVVDNAVKNAPAGTDGAVALFKSAVAAGQNAIESAQNAAKQAVELAESNFTAVTDQVVNAAAVVSKKA
jgi:phasin family protein